MQQEHDDMVPVDFNGAAWRRKRGEDQRRDSTIEEAFATANVPIPDGLHHSGTRWRPRRMGRCMCGTSACTVHLRLIVTSLVSSPPTEVATMKYGFTSCTVTRGWSNVSAPPLEPGRDKTGVHTRRKDAIHTTTCDYSLRGHSPSSVCQRLATYVGEFGGLLVKGAVE